MKTRWIKILVIASVFTVINAGMLSAHPVSRNEPSRQRSFGDSHYATDRHRGDRRPTARQKYHHHKHYRKYYKRYDCKPRVYYRHYRNGRRSLQTHHFIFGFLVVDPKGAFSFDLRKR